MTKIKKITQNSNQFPSVLRTIPDPPKQIYVIGDITKFSNTPMLAVIGTRKVSPYGRQVTTSLVEAIARKGVVIVSGLALGVDSIAHAAALESGGQTIAVLPCGLDRIYPSSHYTLAKRIVDQGGVLISEYPEGTEPYPFNFIARNRIVSGLSDGVLITEAATKSGTLHTANFALEQGKTVMAVPGNFTQALSAGTNNLLKTGAVLVTDPSDVLTALGLRDTPAHYDELLGDNEQERQLLSLLAQGISDADQLLIHSKLDVQLFNQTLTLLEITGKIRPLGAGHWAIAA